MKKLFKSVLTFIICLIIVYGVAAVGGLFTSNEINSDWYNSVRPIITPPNWVFPIVWNILFFLIGVSLFMAWTKSKNEKTKREVAWVFGVNLILNIIWSILYFGMHNPLWAFIDILLLMISIASMIFISWKVSKISSWLLLPYLIWIYFASVLNFMSI